MEWHNYNTPPLLRLYHYQTKGIKEPTLGVITKMKLAADLIFVVSFINFLNNCLQMGSDCDLIRPRQVMYSIFNLIIWPSCAHFSFYYGYYGIL
mmetsp:Transcript_22971/g.35457  ORF Transcript_22971/g.35457 Transcript_22971/m.35457 type:complete len:94 (+) Transcript_22971:126-407(+)